MEPWIGAPENIEDYLGFIYLITSPEGRMYVGKKQFWSSVKRKPLKGKKRNRRDKRESDWATYFGSSNELLADLKRTGPLGWRREILRLCKSKWELSYFELMEQLRRNALLDPAFYNGIINVRLNKPPKDLIL